MRGAENSTNHANAPHFATNMVYEGVRFKSLYTIPKAVVRFYSINTNLSIQPFINAITQSS